MAEYISRAALMGKLTGSEAQQKFKAMTGAEAYNEFLAIVNGAEDTNVEPFRCTGEKCPLELGNVLRCTMRGCPWRTTTRAEDVTNADRIRAMTDEELGDFLWQFDESYLEGVMPFCKNTVECTEKLDSKDITAEMCKQCFLDKLRQPYKEEPSCST